jgi:hypothetical protein
VGSTQIDFHIERLRGRRVRNAAGSINVRHHAGGVGASRPACVHRDVRHELADLLWSHPRIESTIQVLSERFGPVERLRDRHRDHRAVPLGELRALPYLAEENLLLQLSQKWSSSISALIWSRRGLGGVSRGRWAAPRGAAADRGHEGRCDHHREAHAPHRSWSASVPSRPIGHSNRARWDARACHETLNEPDWASPS